MKWTGEGPIASIDDFVEHRWADAKAVLRKLDGRFVDHLESAVRLEALELTTPWPDIVQRRPRQRLSTEWHRLLEACFELTMQARILQVSAVSLTTDANRGMPRDEIGRRASYHFRSWFIHTNTLAERANAVIGCTTEVYLADRGAGTELARRQKERVRQEVIERFKEQRHEYAHGARRSWGSAMTEDQYWESNVSIGMLPQIFLDDFHYPGEGERLESGKYELFAAETQVVFDCLGGILLELESELPVLQG